MDTDQENYQPRNVCIVSCYICHLIPDDHAEFKEEIMNFIKNVLCYVPPEDMILPGKWMRLEIIMKKYLPRTPAVEDLDAAWKQKIIDVYIGKTVVPETY